MVHRVGYFLTVGSVLMTIAIVLASCAGRKGTMRLYDMERGKPLPPEKVARIALNDMKGFGYRLQMRFDTRDSLTPRDTIEVLPGEHGLLFRFRTADPTSPIERNDLFRFRTVDPTMPIERYEPEVERSGSCMYFEFVAQAGHLYEFRIVEFKFNNSWRVDLVDLTDTTQVIHESRCRRDKWWLKIHEQEG